MTLKEEIVFYIEAKMKAEKAGMDAGFEDRLKMLFLEGSISEKAYPILMDIFEFKRVVPKPIVLRGPVVEEVKKMVITDSCGPTGGSRFTPRC